MPQTRSSVKSGANVSLTSAHDKRVAAGNEIRRDKRSDAIGKRRRQGNEQENVEQVTAKRSIKDIVESLRALQSKSPAERTPLLVEIRSLLAAPNVDVTPIVESGVVDLLIAEISPSSQPMSQENCCESLWSITNITADSYANSIKILPALPLLLGFIDINSPIELQEHAAWALGNLASEDCKIRDELVAGGATEALIALFQHAHSINSEDGIKLIHISAWALANLAKSSIVNISNFSNSHFLHLLFRDWTSQTSSVSVEVAFMLAHIAQHSLQACASLVDAGVIAAIFDRIAGFSSIAADQWSKSPDASVASIEHCGTHDLKLPAVETESVNLIPLLRTINQVALFLAPDRTNMLMANGLMLVEFLRHCCNHQHRGVRRDALIATSHLSATDDPKVADAIVSSGLAEDALVQVDMGQFDYLNPVIGTAFNLCSHQNGRLVKVVLKDMDRVRKLVKGVVTMIRARVPDISLICVRFFGLLLDHHCSETPFVGLVEEEQGIESLDLLINDPNPIVWKEANALMDRWFGDENEDEV